jgi:hypothetical protein
MGRVGCVENHAGERLRSFVGMDRYDTGIDLDSAMECYQGVPSSGRRMRLLLVKLERGVKWMLASTVALVFEHYLRFMIRLETLCCTDQFTHVAGSTVGQPWDLQSCWKRLESRHGTSSTGVHSGNLADRMVPKRSWTWPRARQFVQVQSF